MMLRHLPVNLPNLRPGAPFQAFSAQTPHPERIFIVERFDHHAQDDAGICVTAVKGLGYILRDNDTMRTIQKNVHPSFIVSRQR